MRQEGQKHRRFIYTCGLALCVILIHLLGLRTLRKKFPRTTHADGQAAFARCIKQADPKKHTSTLSDTNSKLISLKLCDRAPMILAYKHQRSVSKKLNMWQCFSPTMSRGRRARHIFKEEVATQCTTNMHVLSCIIIKSTSVLKDDLLFSYNTSCPERLSQTYQPTNLDLKEYIH